MVRIDFEIVSEITDVETVATGTGVRDRARLRKQYGRAKWRKVKGIAKVRLPSGGYDCLRFIGMKRTASGRKSLN